MQEKRKQKLILSNCFRSTIKVVSQKLEPRMLTLHNLGFSFGKKKQLPSQQRQVVTKLTFMFLLAALEYHDRIEMIYQPEYIVAYVQVFCCIIKMRLQLLFALVLMNDRSCGSFNCFSFCSSNSNKNAKIYDFQCAAGCKLWETALDTSCKVACVSKTFFLFCVHYLFIIEKTVQKSS